MKVLVTAIQKGGQGKTFTTCHLAFDALEKGLKVVVIDLDTQSNASWTLENYKSGFLASKLFIGSDSQLQEHLASADEQSLFLIEADAGLANLDKMTLGEAATQLRTKIEIMSEHFDLCLIDTAPSLGVAMTAAILVSDYMVSPIELEAYSLQGMKKMVAVISNLRKQNPKLKFLGMIPNKVDARKPRHISNLAALRAAYPQLILPFTVGSRDSIAQALGEQIPVWEIKKTAARKAAHEVKAMTDYIFKKMEIV